MNVGDDQSVPESVTTESHDGVETGGREIETEELEEVPQRRRDQTEIDQAIALLRKEFAEELAGLRREIAGVTRERREEGICIAEAIAGVASKEGKEHDTFTEIKHLLHIESNRVYNAALKEWHRKEKYFGQRVDRREQTSGGIINQIYNIVGFFSVFQGVVLTAVSQLTQTNSTRSQPLCGKIWFPIVLSGFAWVVAVVGLWHKFTILKDLEFSIAFEKHAQREAGLRTNVLRREGENFKFHDLHINSNRTQPKSFWIDKIGVIVASFAFTVICILSYFVILCDKWVIKSWK